jgi:hypothetical protein
MALLTVQYNELVPSAEVTELISDELLIIPSYTPVAKFCTVVPLIVDGSNE